MNELNHTQPQEIWLSQPVEEIKMSADVLRQRAGKFESQILWRNVREYAGALIAALLFGYFSVKTHDVLFRIAYALFIAGLGWVVFQLQRKGSARNIPAAMGTSTCLQFFRAELERQRDVVKNVWPWYLAPLVPGFIVLTIGSVQARPQPAGLLSAAFLDLIVTVLFYLIWKMNMRAAGHLQRMIDEMNANEK